MDAWLFVDTRDSANLRQSRGLTGVNQSPCWMAGSSVSPLLCRGFYAGTVSIVLALYPYRSKYGAQWRRMRSVVAAESE